MASMHSTSCMFFRVVADRGVCLCGHIQGTTLFQPQEPLIRGLWLAVDYYSLLPSFRGLTYFCNSAR